MTRARRYRLSRTVAVLVVIVCLVGLAIYNPTKSAPERDQIKQSVSNALHCQTPGTSPHIVTTYRLGSWQISAWCDYRR